MASPSLSKPVVALVAPGNMGAALGARLVEQGAEVLTSLRGRSEASRERAQAAGMIDADDERLVQADFLLSVVPPAAAQALADRMAPLLASARRKPLYVDCNAVSPATVRRIAGRVTAAGAAFVDAGIIGPPPRAGSAGTRLYASGPHAARFSALAALGLDVRALDAPIGAASALKLSYAGITKGLTAIGTAMVLAATRSGVAEVLRAELAESQREMLAYFERTIPQMFPKAYRWVAEMDEIAAFSAEGAGAAQIYGGASVLYAHLASDVAGPRADVERLEAFLRRR